MKDKKFKLSSKYKPSGDQPNAIESIVKGLEENKSNQVLMGVTGSGKTFTVANIIEQTQRPAIIMAHNKTLAAQLYSELKEFFPENAVEYFISFFDYYQPEAYIPSSDTFIDKDSVINDKIEQMKHAAIYSLLERRDTIVVASVSAIYGIGERSYYEQMKMTLSVGEEIAIHDLCLRLATLQYKRNDITLERASFRVRGDTVEILPAHFEDHVVRISFFGDEIESIDLLDSLTSRKIESLEYFRFYAATLYAIPQDVVTNGISRIREDLYETVEQLKSENKLIEAQRIQERTNFDIEMLTTTGYCKGIENYVRYFSSREPGSTPSTLFDYLPKDMLAIIDESHVTVPQIRGMFNADRSRKNVLVKYGFRLPSCVDNRPLTFEEWEKVKGDSLYVSATPSVYELEKTNGEVIEQIIRPTGLLDPICNVRPTENQIYDTMMEIKKRIPTKEKVLVVALTKKLSEHITEFFNENGIRAKYIHSDIDTVERVQIIRELREDNLDTIIGINLLREGLDIPECSLVVILDADKEGFLRSKTSLIQTIGRAARNSEGQVILYADKMTESLKYAISESERRRAKQEKWNKDNNITPKTVVSSIIEIDLENKHYKASNKKDKNKSEKNEFRFFTKEDLEKEKIKLSKEMKLLAEDLEFEKAILVKEKIKKIDSLILELI